MSDFPNLYRRRLIPDECILLKNDRILYRDKQTLITKWTTIRPKKELDHGISCYMLKDGWKVSRFLNKSGGLICWYCDIIDTRYNEDDNTYIFTDLLADVLIYPDGTVKVVDLDEVADALEARLITESQVRLCLRRLNALLLRIYDGTLLSDPGIQKMTELAGE